MEKKVHITSRYSGLLVTFVIIAEVAICGGMFSLFSILSGYIHEEHFLQSFSMVCTIYFAVTIENGVSMHMRKSNDYEVLLTVLKNVFYFSIFSVLILHVGNFYVFRWPLYLCYLISLFVLLLAFRYLIRLFAKVYHQMEKNRRKVIMIGAGYNNKELCKEFLSNRSMGYEVLGFFDDDPEQQIKGVKRLGGTGDVVNHMKGNDDVQEVYCCLPPDYKMEVQEQIIRYCENNFRHFFLVPIMNNFQHQDMHLNVIGSIPYMSYFDDPLSTFGNRLIKRIFDVVFSLVFLVTLFPIIFVVVAIVTKITMPGPIFFKQKRSGINGKEFWLYKFRSMKVNDNSDNLQATKDDPRKTVWGNILRKTSLDETPQFFNVLLGDMSVVGPRPHMIKHTEEYSQLINHYMIRHYIKPGITGWSQITGFRGETKELCQMDGRVKGDIWYMEHWNMWLDLYIILKTIYNAIAGDKNAY
ncbi:MAG: undecaprenyl-phosphate glucose phosphotransferase [Muribaculaceae bacterium]